MNSSIRPWRRWITLAAVLVLLDASLTFHNIWPTPAIGWRGELSIELAAFVLGLVAIGRWPRLAAPAVRRPLAALWLLLVVGRYVEVTTPALWGRGLNVYWDLQFVPDVASMLARAAPLWLVVIALASIGATLALAYWLLRRALDYLCHIVTEREPRIALAIAAIAVVLLFVGTRLNPPAPAPDYSPPVTPLFSTPVTQTYLRQAGFIIHALTGSHSLAPSPSFDADLSAVQGADVLLIFLESYGAVAFEQSALAAPLASPRAALDSAIRDVGREVVSAYVESPTFGGSSWLAHISLLSGLDVRDPDTNALLMTEHRDTMPTAFAHHGYRTVAMMPGLWYPWPEGAFYGFQDTYNAERLNYTGPGFGWWSLSDQFVLAKLDSLERAKQPRAPVFVFFPTVNTHTPFLPIPPYQPDWSRMLTDHPFNDDAVERAYFYQPDWLDLGPSYVEAMTYTYEMLAGYLREHAGEDFVMILVGDHQPPAVVSGEGAPWDVPVHVITSRRQVLDALLARGFRNGITPSRPGLGKMDALTPVLLDSFSTHR